MVMNWQRGDIVKFEGREEPCVIYRIFDAEEIIIETDLGGRLACKIPKPHVAIEVLGYVPTEMLVPVAGHKDNIFGFEFLLKQSGRLS
jgi:hypothetical protein